MVEGQSLTEDMMPQVIRRCCKSLPCQPIPRARDDGHFTVLYPNIRATKYLQAWQSGAVDLTWKCWACLGSDLGKSFDELVEVHVPWRFSETYVAQRHVQQEKGHYRETPSGVYCVDEWLQRRYKDLWRRTKLQAPLSMPEMPLA